MTTCKCGHETSEPHCCKCGAKMQVHPLAANLIRTKRLEDENIALVNRIKEAVAGLPAGDEKGVKLESWHGRALSRAQAYAEEVKALAFVIANWEKFAAWCAKNVKSESTDER